MQKIYSLQWYFIQKLVLSENLPTFQITSLGTKIAFLSPSTTFAFSLRILSNIGFLAAQVLRLTDVIANLVGLRNIPSFIHVGRRFHAEKRISAMPPKQCHSLAV